ncbi:MAG TPA: tetratricopeptide repeat protein [Rhodocyclaceae bacterium]|nr:tetratricopeptide repeat protein [Rhodocyclaceae bacterium]
MDNVHSSSPLEQAYALALQLYQAGGRAETEEACRVILAADPQQAEVLLLLGTCQWDRGDAAQAIALYDLALAAKPDLAEAHFNRGLALRALGNGAEALASYDAAIALRPLWAEAYFNKGNLLQDVLVSPVDALAAFDQAIRLKPDLASAHCNRGNALRTLGRTEEAIAAYQDAVVAAADYADAYYNKGELLQELGRYTEARESYQNTLAIQPSHGKALNNLGAVALQQGDVESALGYFDSAIRAEPRYASAHNNRGVALKAMERLEDARESYSAAVELDPQYAAAYCNRGQLLQQMLLLDEAMADYQRALAIRPDYPECKWNEALCLLLNGQFAAGWDMYEWRWQMAEHGHAPSMPLAWSGQESIAEKTVLLWAEQGFGDTLQFCRYVSLLAARGAHVVLEVQPALVPLLQSLPGVYRVIAAGSERPAYDWHCPLLSLPRAFATDMHSIPAEVPYIACPESKRVHWNERLGAGSGPRVGLVWSGSPTHKGDQWRSIPLRLLRSLAEIRGAEFFSLQADVREADRAALSSLPIRHFGGDLNDFSDTAALADAMDLVVTVDTSVAHLAGALGKPVWIMLPHFPDWRWLLERTDSPWYPTVRLFRQTQRCEWGAVIEEVAASLLEWLPQASSR